MDPREEACECGRQATEECETPVGRFPVCDKDGCTMRAMAEAEREMGEPHTLIPWVASNADDGSGLPGWNIVGADGWTACSMMDANRYARAINPKNAALIVRAVNAHEALAAALREALPLMLEDAARHAASAIAYRGTFNHTADEAGRAHGVRACCMDRIRAALKLADGDAR